MNKTQKAAERAINALSDLYTMVSESNFDGEMNKEGNALNRAIQKYRKVMNADFTNAGYIPLVVEAREALVKAIEMFPMESR